MINIFTDEGKINENGGKFAGLQRFDARKAILEELKTLGSYKETKDNKMVLPICGRSGNIVEPLLKPQWYIRCDEMFQDAMDAVKNGDLEIQPEVSRKEWFKWLGNPQDWCISRQLWWGHRIPAYLISIKGEAMDVSSCFLIA
jgi:valyl-tRNA synthetase